MLKKTNQLNIYAHRYLHTTRQGHTILKYLIVFYTLKNKHTCKKNATVTRIRNANYVMIIFLSFAPIQCKMQEVSWSAKEREDFGEEKRLYNDSFQIYKKIFLFLRR